MFNFKIIEFFDDNKYINTLNDISWVHLDNITPIVDELNIEFGSYDILLEELENYNIDISILEKLKYMAANQNINNDIDYIKIYYNEKLDKINNYKYQIVINDNNELEYYNNNVKITGENFFKIDNIDTIIENIIKYNNDKNNILNSCIYNVINTNCISMVLFIFESLFLIKQYDYNTYLKIIINDGKPDNYNETIIKLKELWSEGTILSELDVKYKIKYNKYYNNFSYDYKLVITEEEETNTNSTKSNVKQESKKTEEETNNNSTKSNVKQESKKKGPTKKILRIMDKKKIKKQTNKLHHKYIKKKINYKSRYIILFIFIAFLYFYFTPLNI